MWGRTQFGQPKREALAFLRGEFSPSRTCEPLPSDKSVADSLHRHQALLMRSQGAEEPVKVKVDARGEVEGIAVAAIAAIAED
jgi:hypothetical protein